MCSVYANFAFLSPSDSSIKCSVWLLSLIQLAKLFCWIFPLTLCYQLSIVCYLILFNSANRTTLQHKRFFNVHWLAISFVIFLWFLCADCKIVGTYKPLFRTLILNTPCFSSPWSAVSYLSWVNGFLFLKFFLTHRHWHLATHRWNIYTTACHHL